MRVRAHRTRNKAAGIPRPKDAPVTPSIRTLHAESERLRQQALRAAGVPRRKDRPRLAIIVGVDGEGLTRDDGSHDYTLLADSTGRQITSDGALDTESCLRFLLSLSGKLVVGYGLSYDVNKMLSSLRPGRLLRIHKRGHTFWQSPDGYVYRIEYTPRKCLRISEIMDKVSVRTVTVWDTLGFYQTGFVKALRAWKIGTPDELALLDGMKGLRSDFANVSPERIKEYNDLECKLLVELTAALRATIEKAGYRLGRWDGAGALASAMLRKHGVKAHLSESYPIQAMHAYFGGRIQLLQLGEIDGPIYNYDINSAYPSVARNLPSLASGRWERTPDHRPADVALWRVRWNLQERPQIRYPDQYVRPVRYKSSGDNPSPILTPFPFRDKTGNIHYPIRGEGWYWSPLVDLARKHWDFEVIDGYVLQQTDSDTGSPFGWVDGLYRERQLYKAQNDPRHIILKLGLNAVYGKLAQGVGWRDSKPTYTNYVWAGLITATTQARLLEAALRKPDSIIAFATDGIYATESLEIPLSEKLGEWELTVYDKMLVFQPGLYVLEKDGKRVHRTRGYFPEEIDWDEMLRVWRKDHCHGTYQFNVSRFLSLGIALQTKSFHLWGRWVDSPRDVALRPASGFYGEKIAEHRYRWEPDYDVKGCEVSEPFSVKRSKNEMPQDIRRGWDEDQPDPLL